MFILLTLLVVPLVVAQSTPIVSLPYATYRGTYNATSSISSFLGIRYAAPPDRWAALSPPPTVLGVQDATQQPNQCMQCGVGRQLTNPFNVTHNRREKRQTAVVSSEDCLFLNIFIPGFPSPERKTKFPVIVWIHGGGYHNGNAGFPSQDLVEGSGGELIAVNIQYRLGLFGFLPGRGVKEGGGVLNAGLLDQQFALQWVQEHISAFGGDPKQVTIWGESAGAGSVLQQLIANGGETAPPLFKGAITSSTFLPTQFDYGDQIPEELYNLTLNFTGCSTFDCLHTAPLDALQTANTNISNSDFFGLWTWAPVVDQSFIRQSPVRSILEGKLNGEVLLSVTNTFEGRVFVNAATASQTLGLESYVKNAFPALDTSQVGQVVATYEALGGTVDDQAIGVQGESIFICPTYYLLEAFRGRAFKGEFAIPPGNHGDDTPYYFFPDEVRGSQFFNNQSFIDAFRSSFFSMAVNATPSNNVNKPTWPRYDEGENRWEILFNKTVEGGLDVRVVQTDEGLLKRCGLWARLAPFTKQ